MHRSAATLIEVLVAIFIMAIGLLTLLTLFPLGALSMSQAIQDDRAAHAVANAMAAATSRSLRNDQTVTGYPGDLFVRPHGRSLPASHDRRSYPLYVDPFGVVLSSNTVANIRHGIPRRSVSWVDSSQNPEQTRRKWFTILDDMHFADVGNNLGIPATTSVGTQNNVVEREGRYSWAYLLVRPQATVTNVVDLTIVVYKERLFQLPLGETAYKGVTFDPRANVVTITWDPTTQPKPPVRKGGWILDGTLPTAPGQVPHGFFYRVVGISDVADGTMVLELQSKPKMFTNNGTLIVMENVVEVFEKGTGWQP